MAFQKDLKRGEVGVDVFQHYLNNEILSKEDKVEIAEGNNPKWDIRVKTKGRIKKTFEVKYDEKSAKTGNLCFEITNGKVPTGILKSEADMIVYVCPAEDGFTFYMFDREELIKFLLYSTMAKLPGVRTVFGGDGDKFGLVLINLKNISEDICKIIGYNDYGT